MSVFGNLKECEVEARVKYYPLIKSLGSSVAFSYMIRTILVVQGSGGMKECWKGFVDLFIINYSEKKASLLPNWGMNMENVVFI